MVVWGFGAGFLMGLSLARLRDHGWEGWVLPLLALALLVYGMRTQQALRRREHGGRHTDA